MTRVLEVLHFRIILLLAMVAMLPSVPASATSPESATTLTTEQLATLLTRASSSSVQFVEHQYRSVLKQPIVLQGELNFTPPATFERVVSSPRRERYRIVDDTLTIEMPGHSPRQLSTRNQPLLRGMLLGFQAVVSGQLQTLEPVYSLQLSGNTQAWQLLLTPTDAALARYIKSVLINGNGNAPRRFEITEINGDHTVTELMP